MPSVERVCARLRHKFPEAAEELIVRRARKFTEKIFPLFLTREAAMLKILERDLPIAYRDRVPRVISMEQDERGYVRRLWMNWLRARTPRHQPLTQLEFARQSADLLRVMHDEANIIHLDLRLDNVVITDRGVGFVDFGSAVREGENISGNPLLSTIFDELMRTSQIQKMLDRMMTEGKVTSHVLGNAYGKVDKGVDLFYLAVSINAPLINPDFQGLVTHDTAGEESAGLSMLTQDVLKPQGPQQPADQVRPRPAPLDRGPVVRLARQRAEAADRGRVKATGRKRFGLLQFCDLYTSRRPRGYTQPPSPCRKRPCAVPAARYPWNAPRR